MVDLLALEELAAERNRYALVIASAVADGHAFTLTDEIVDGYRHHRDAWRSAADRAVSMERRA